MLGEQLLAAVGLELDEALAGLGQLDVAFSHLCEAQKLQRLGNREQIVYLHVQRARQDRQVGMTAIGLGRQDLHETGMQVGRNARQHHRDAAPGEHALGRLAHGARRHAGVNVVDELAKRRIEPVARLRQGQPRFPPRPCRGWTKRPGCGPHISTASSMLCVTSRIDEIGMRPSLHRSRRSVRKVSAVSTSSAENGSSISSTLGCDDQRAGQADPLAHAARQLLRIGALEAVEADQIDGGERALVALGRRRCPGLRDRSRRFPER